MLTRKLFLVCSHSDVDITEKYFLPLIRDDLQLHYVTQTEAVRYNWTVDKIANMIAECDRTVVLVTQNSLRRNWIHYKTLKALEICQKIKQTGVIVVLLDVNAEEVRHHFFGVLQDADCAYFNTNLEHGKDTFRDELYEKLKARLPLPPRLRLSDTLWKGLYWSYYMKHLHPLLHETKIPDIFHTYPVEKSSHLQFIIIINSDKPILDLEQLDARIKKKGQWLDAAEKVAHNVYSILDVQTKDTYYFMGHIPKGLNILHKLEMGRYSDSEADRTSIDSKMSAGERSLQVTRFYNDLNRLVHHPVSKDCNELACLIHYDDTDPRSSIADVLLDKIKYHLQTRGSKHQTIPRSKMWSDSSWEKLPSPVNKNVGLVGPRTSYRDPTFIDVMECLQRNSFHVWTASFQCEEILKAVMNHCKWTIIILSKECLEEEQSCILGLHFREALPRNVHERQTKVILILDGVEETEVPYELPVVTCISKREPAYLETLVGTMKWMDIRSCSLLNIVDVHQGMAWDYVENDLRKKLPDHVKELHNLQQRNQEYSVCQKLYIIIPASCSVTSQWELDRDNEGNLIYYQFERLNDTTDTQTVGEAASNKDRRIACPYWLKWDFEEYVVSIEFPEPLNYLRKMLDMACVSGLSEDQVQSEVWGFRQLTQAILDADPFLRDRAKLIFYDDKVLNIYDIMSETLEEEFEEQSTIL